MSDVRSEKLRSKHRAWHRIRSKADRFVYRKESKKFEKAIKSAKILFQKELGERAKSILSGSTAISERLWLRNKQGC